MKTTSKTLCLLTSLFFVSQVSAQTLNFSGGVSINNIEYQFDIDQNSVSSFNGTTSYFTQKKSYLLAPSFGVSYEFNFGNHFSLESGFRFMNRGILIERTYRTETATTFNQSAQRYAYKSRYIDIPVTLNSYITTGNIKTYVRTGIYGSFLINQQTKSRIENTNSEGNNTTTEKINNDFQVDFKERFASGLQLGAGASFKGFFFETNFNIGVLNLNNFDTDITTRDFSFVVGYKLNLSKK